MGYKNLRQCVNDLAQKGELVEIEHEVDPKLEVGAIQRRVFANKGPALLFKRIKGSPFPMVGNLFGTLDRVKYIFRDSLPVMELLFKISKDPKAIFFDPKAIFFLPQALWHLKPRFVKHGPILEAETRASNLPQLVSWPKDGGAYITLPQVYTEHPKNPGIKNSNLGMYRIQLSGNKFQTDREVGLHYQIHRGIGIHHAQALTLNQPLPVHVFVGGPPALTLAAVMPLPAGLSELFFASILAGHRIPLLKTRHSPLPIPAEADFCLCGQVQPGQVLPEGPFGDHLGYYSLTHDFPVLQLQKVYCRKKAYYPFTTVGRPPQEDSVFGEFIHELVNPLLSTVFSGVKEINAVDAAGVHPLLLAIGSERYVPFAQERIPQELLTNALALLGSTQTSLSKYLLITDQDDAPGLSTKNIPLFFHHVLQRVDFSRDLHFITRTTMDTLDYSGISLNQGSKLILAATGQPKRNLGKKLPHLHWPDHFKHPAMFAPGIVLVQGPGHELSPDQHDPIVQYLSQKLNTQLKEDSWPLFVVVDDVKFTGKNWENFLWVTFTRSDPATDIYGLDEKTHCKHWGSGKGIIIDARLKSFHAPPLEPDPEVEKKVDELGIKSGPLHGFI